MKKMIRLLTLSAAVAMLAVPVVSAQDQCTQEAKDGYYAAFRENFKNDQAKAYEAAKKHLACPAGEATEAQTNITNYLKKWVTAYEDGSRKLKLPQLIYNDKKYPEAYALGKEILTAEPENLKVLVDLGANGYLLTQLKNPALNADAVTYARKAIELLEAGKTVDAWTPLSGKDEALAYLNYTIGSLTLDKDPEGALKALLKSAQYETPLKKSPYTYAFIAGAYETGPYAKQSEAYKVCCSGKDETPESKLALANINQLVERMIDGYARAVALAGADAKFASIKTVWSESLSTWYKYLHKSETGMNELVAGVLAKPLPPEPTPLTSLPNPTPAATPTGTATGTNGASTATQPGAKPATPVTVPKPAGAKP
jgi:hypothetical protein